MWWNGEVGLGMLLSFVLRNKRRKMLFWALEIWCFLWSSRMSGVRVQLNTARGRFSGGDVSLQQASVVQSMGAVMSVLLPLMYEEFMEF